MFSKFEPRACSRCDRPHICTLTIHCPCMEEEISDQLLDRISSHYEDCLCAGCLKELKEIH
jgi:hypothetical protein